MANDRLSLGCTRCGLRVTVLKYYPENPFVIDMDRVGPFLLDHLQNCHPQMYQTDLGKDSCFVIVTEEGEDLLDSIVAYRKSEDTVKT